VSTSVAVVGAGWSGLAAAVALVDAGHHVTLLDAAPRTGGRARRLALELGDRSFGLDNGQHLLIGAYAEYLALARRVGVDIAARFLVQPFALRYPDGFRMAALPAPAPLHLAGALLLARGPTWADRFAAAHWVRHWQRRNWTLEEADRAAATLFEAHPARMTQRLWAPLCLAALNVRLADASARMLLRVLGDSLGAMVGASHLYLARGDLSTLLPDAAERHIVSAGGAILLREPVQTLAFDATTSRWRLGLRARAIEVNALILAIPPARCAAILTTAARSELAQAVAQLERVKTAPIATVYLRYPPGTRLAHPAYALDERPAQDEYGQWVFDRGQLEASNAGIFSVVVSGTGPHEELAAPVLAGNVSRQLARCFNVGEPIAHAVTVEKRATIVPAPGLVRPPARLPMPGLFVASDAADSPYPSTLEGSVRSGLAAAQAAVAYLRLSAA
jgi:hydroxysqualene dehydroxylase